MLKNYHAYILQFEIPRESWSLQLNMTGLHAISLDLAGVKPKFCNEIRRLPVCAWGSAEGPRRVGECRINDSCTKLKTF